MRKRDGIRTTDTAPLILWKGIVFMRKRSYFKCPNALVTDDRLSYVARKVGMVLFAFSTRLGFCRKSYAEIAKLAGCSTAAVQEAVARLAELDYISYAAQKRYVQSIGTVGYGKNAYSVNLNVLKDGYTQLSREVFEYDLKGAAFIICICVLVAAGNKKRAFPSISQLQKMSSAVRSTVCAALRLLKRLPSLLVQLCVRQNRTFAANSYHIVSKAPAAVSCPLAVNEASATSTGSSARSYSIIKKLLQQGLNRIFSVFSVVRKKVSKAKT